MKFILEEIRCEIFNQKGKKGNDHRSLQ